MDAIEGQGTTGIADVARDPSAAEATLVERARRGDHDAFAAIVDMRLAASYRVALGILGNDADARDATQECFLLAWRKLPGLRDPSRFGFWFHRILVNTCRTAIRGRRRHAVRELQVSVLPAEGEDLPAAGEGPGDRLVAADSLDRALDRISPAERTILWLHHHEQRSLAEIGALLGIPPRTVKSRLFTARRALERALEVESR